MTNVTPIRPEPEAKARITLSPATQAFIDKYDPQDDK